MGLLKKGWWKIAWLKNLFLSLLVSQPSNIGNNDLGGDKKQGKNGEKDTENDLKDANEVEDIMPP